MSSKNNLRWLSLALAIAVLMSAPVFASEEPPPAPEAVYDEAQAPESEPAAEPQPEPEPETEVDSEFAPPEEAASDHAAEVEPGRPEESEPPEETAGPEQGPVPDGAGDIGPVTAVGSYALAPSGYVLLRVRNDLPDGQVYAFNGAALFYTDNSAFLVSGGDGGVFVGLIPARYASNGSLTDGGSALLTTVEAGRTQLTYSADINSDGAVDIADANAIYQLVHNGGDYYSQSQVSLTARLRVLYRSAVDFDAVMDEVNRQ